MKNKLLLLLSIITISYVSHIHCDPYDDLNKANIAQSILPAFGQEISALVDGNSENMLQINKISSDFYTKTMATINSKKLTTAETITLLQGLVDAVTEASQMKRNGKPDIKGIFTSDLRFSSLSNFNKFINANTSSLIQSLLFGTASFSEKSSNSLAPLFVQLKKEAVDLYWEALTLLFNPHFIQINQIFNNQVNLAGHPIDSTFNQIGCFPPATKICSPFLDAFKKIFGAIASIITGNFNTQIMTLRLPESDFHDELLKYKNSQNSKNFITSTQSAIQTNSLTDPTSLPLTIKINGLVQDTVKRANSLYDIDKYTILNAINQKWLGESLYFSDTFFPTMKTVADFNKFFNANTIDKMKEVLHPELGKSSVEELITETINNVTNKVKNNSPDNVYYALALKSYWQALVEILPYLQPIANFLNSKDGASSLDCKNSEDETQCQQNSDAFKRISSYLYYKMKWLLDKFQDKWKAAAWNIDIAVHNSTILADGSIVQEKTTDLAAKFENNTQALSLTSQVSIPLTIQFNNLVLDVVKTATTKFHNDYGVPRAILMIKQGLTGEDGFFRGTFFPNIKTLSDLNKFMAANTIDKMKDLLHPELSKTTIDQIIESQAAAQKYGQGGSQLQIDIYSDYGYQGLGEKLYWGGLVALLPYMQPMVDFLNSKDGFSSISCNNSLNEGQCKPVMDSLNTNIVVKKMPWLLDRFQTNWSTAGQNLTIALQNSMILPDQVIIGETLDDLSTNFKNAISGALEDAKSLSYNIACTNSVLDIMKQSEQFHHDGLVPRAITMIKQTLLSEAQFFNAFFDGIKTVSDLNTFMNANTVDKMKNLLHPEQSNTTIDQLIEKQVKAQTPGYQLGIDVASDAGYRLLGQKLVWETLVASLPFMQPLVDFLNSKDGASSKSCNNFVNEGHCIDFMKALGTMDIYGKLNWMLDLFLGQWNAAGHNTDLAIQNSIIVPDKIIINDTLKNLTTQFKKDTSSGDLTNETAPSYNRSVTNIIASIMKQSEKFHHDLGVPRAVIMIKQTLLSEVQFFYSTFFPGIKTVSDLNTFMIANTVDKMKNLLHPELSKTTIDQLIENEVENQTTVGADQLGIEIYSDKGYLLLGQKLVWETLVASLPYMQPLVTFLNSKEGVSSISCKNSLNTNYCQDAMTGLRSNDIYGKMNWLLSLFQAKWEAAGHNTDAAIENFIIRPAKGVKF
ncbi:hypothetical protein K9K77_01370 [Candidatus Babeliales bacterium]|nr:hypothetical protein [Candidatus Babeliales bacterium]